MNMILADPNDTPMQEVLRFSIDDAEGDDFTDQRKCINYIAEMGMAQHSEKTQEQRISWGRHTLEKELLAHVG